MNVLIALFDPAHVQHDAAHAWFSREGRAGWATCPITENGLVRILSNPRYPNSPGGPAAVLPLLWALRGLEGHQFWADTISLADTSRFPPHAMLRHDQLTDVYLLALAVEHGGRLATFDRKLASAAVTGGAVALVLL